MTPAQAALSSAIAARASPRAAGVAAPSGTTRPPPLRDHFEASVHAELGRSSGNGVIPASAWTSVPSAASAACAGDTPSSISRRISVSRARSAAV